MALSMDRFIAIQKPLRYQNFVTHKRVIPAVTVMWSVSAILGLFICVCFSRQNNYCDHSDHRIRLFCCNDLVFLQDMHNGETTQHTNSIPNTIK